MGRWQQVEEILQRALDCPPQERAAFLEAACAGDEELKSEATTLVRAFDEAGAFLEQPAIEKDARVLIGDLPDAQIGRTVGSYKIVGRLGAGGMGEVFLAQDARLGRLVALKMLPAYFVADDMRLRRFQREARAASALSHPNILTIHEVGEAEEARFIATEYIDGQTIRALIAGQELSLEEVLDIAVQVASGLEAAHAAGIVHRDIKPENIMRRGDGLVKILDFGIAKLNGLQIADCGLRNEEAQTLASDSQSNPQSAIRNPQLTAAGVVMGTVGYMSPEQARGLPVDERTDIWSFGVVLYEMLARRAPFAGATRMDTLVAILEREPPPLIPLTKDISPQLRQLQLIVEKTLHKEQSERYQTASALLADLKDVRQQLDLAGMLKGQPVSTFLSAARDVHQRDEEGNAAARVSDSSPVIAAASTASATSQPAGHTRRFRRFAAGIAAVLLIAAMAGAFLYQRSAKQRGANTRSATTTKLYRQMSEAGQLAFINEQEQRISAMMGDRPATLNEDALRAIKNYVDRYVARLGSASSEYGKEDLRAIYARAVPHLPLIARDFAARKVPVIVGLYLPMIESEYKPCFENAYGSKGLFQFLPQTARQYGVAPEEMCDVEKMTPAAAHYIADRMAELGDDAESMTLVLLSYNRGPEWVRDTLRRLRDTANYERNFWTLFAHRDQLDQVFREENAGYVPAFFAAAIVGENPQTFELQTPPFSTMTSANNAANN